MFNIDIVRICILSYAFSSYALAGLVVPYALCFAGGIWVPKTIDTPAASTSPAAYVVDAGLVALFGLQHSLMARDWFKRMLTRALPSCLERSTYVLAASLALCLLCWWWMPVTATVWVLENRLLLWAAWAVFWIGCFVVYYATFSIGHLELLGLKSAVWYVRGEQPAAATFKVNGIYRSRVTR